MSLLINVSRGIDKKNYSFSTYPLEDGTYRIFYRSMSENINKAISEWGDAVEVEDEVLSVNNYRTLIRVRINVGDKKGRWYYGETNMETLTGEIDRSIPGILAYQYAVMAAGKAFFELPSLVFSEEGEPCRYDDSLTMDEHKELEMLYSVCCKVNDADVPLKDMKKENIEMLKSLSIKDHRYATYKTVIEAIYRIEVLENKRKKISVTI